MSLEDVAALRATAHPLRLRMLSLLTGAALSAAELARELDITHANASYHLRQLHAAGLLDVAEEVAVRGGRAKRYRANPSSARESVEPAEQGAFSRLLAEELIRRSAEIAPPPGRRVFADAELWIEPDVWEEISGRIADALTDLHAAARPPRTPDTVRTGATVALFRMSEES